MAKGKKKYLIVIREYLGYRRTTTGRSMPKRGKSRSFTVESRKNLDEFHKEVLRQLGGVAREVGRPKKASQ